MKTPLNEKWFKKIQKIMPKNAEDEEIVFVLVAFLAANQVDNIGRASFLCVEAASKYADFLDEMDGSAEGELH